MNQMQAMSATVKATRPTMTHSEVRSLLLYSTISTQSLDALLNVGQLVLTLGELCADLLHQSRRGTLHELGIVQLVAKHGHFLFSLGLFLVQTSQLLLMVDEFHHGNEVIIETADAAPFQNAQVYLAKFAFATDVTFTEKYEGSTDGMVQVSTHTARGFIPMITRCSR